MPACARVIPPRGWVVTSSRSFSKTSKTRARRWKSPSGPDATRPDAVLRNADLALYRAKADGRSRYAVFDPSMQTGAIERMEIESDLRRALARNELRVYFQPIVDLETGAVNEVEALARWERPGHGTVSPLVF